MPIELKQDSLNVIDLTDIGISLQATEDRIIILVDGYKSGYECKTCKGTGRVPSILNADVLRSCDACQGKGQTIIIPDTAKSMPSTGVVVSMGPETRAEQIINNIRGLERTLAEYAIEGNMYCSDASNTQKNIDYCKRKLKECLIQVGTRVVFGVHVGTKIPIKGNIKLTIMREKEPLCIVFGSDLGDKEILDYTQEY